MGIRGTRPKPTALKELEGNPGGRPLNRDAKTKQRLPSAPKWLQGEGRKEYYRAGRILVKVGIMTESDYTALIAYAELFGRWMEAEEQVRAKGVIVKNPFNGHPMQNPYLSISNHARKECLRMAVEFGMTPSSRSRIQTVDGKKEDQFDAFLEGAYSATHDDAE